MEYDIAVSEDRTYIILKISGDFTANDMLKLVAESHSLGKSLDIHDYLVERVVGCVLEHFR